MAKIAGSTPAGPTYHITKTKKQNKKQNKKQKKIKEEKVKIRMTKKDEEKIFAFLCYLIPLIGVIIVLATKKERSSFSIYHCKQGLVFLISCIIVGIVFTMMGFIPILGWLISGTLWILLAVLWVIGIVNSLTEKKVPLPIIGQFAKSFKF